MSHHGHCILVYTNWLFLSSPHSDPLSFSSINLKMLHTVKTQGNKVRYYDILCFQHEKAFNYTQIVTAIDF